MKGFTTALVIVTAASLALGACGRRAELKELEPVRDPGTPAVETPDTTSLPDPASPEANTRTETLD